MAPRLALALSFVAAAAGVATANGRPPSTTAITFRDGNDADVIAGLTFGEIASHDGGKTWGWLCEDAFGTNAIGTYDPRRVYTPTGALFTTTLNGLTSSRDACTYALLAGGPGFVSTLALGPAPDHAIYYAAAQPADAAHGIAADFQIYKSVDDGKTFPQHTNPTAAGGVSWWQSIKAAPSDPQRVYLTGYVLGAGNSKQLLLYRSDNGGTTWTSLPVTDFVVQPGISSDLEIAAIAPDDADVVYMRVTLDNPTVQGDAIYRSANKGASWTKLRAKDGPIGAFVVRAAKEAGKRVLVLGTQAVGAEISRDDGVTWTALPSPPHMTCLVENKAGELWACTQNYGATGISSDNAGIMKSTDAMSWTKVVRYQELTEVASCAAGTVAHDRCGALWCSVCAQLGCTPASAYGCPSLVDDTPVTPPGKGGCCDAGAGPGGSLALTAVVVGLARRRRPRARGAASR